MFCQLSFNVMIGDRGFIIGAWLNAWNNVKTTLGVEFTANKDVSNGYPSLSGFSLKLKNIAGTITSLLSHSHTVSRTITLQDKNYTIAGLDDLADPALIAVNVYSGGNLVANGHGESGTNYNFSNFAFDTILRPLYSSSGFKITTITDWYQVALVDNFIIGNWNNLFKLNLQIKVGNLDGSDAPANKGVLLWSQSYLTNGIPIYNRNGKVFTGAVDTTLALPVNNGDTTITVTDATGWATSANNSGQRGMQWWPWNSTYNSYCYVSGGKIYQPFTYSEINPNNADVYSTRNGNVLTLSSPWTYGYLQAGTPVSNIDVTGGNNYFYINTNAQGDININKSMSANKNKNPDYLLLRGTEKIKIFCLLNCAYGGVSGATQTVRFSNIEILFIG